MDTASDIRTSYSAIRCVMITPLGFPVVPDVYSTVSVSGA